MLPVEDATLSPRADHRAHILAQPLNSSGCRKNIPSLLKRGKKAADVASPLRVKSHTIILVSTVAIACAVPPYTMRSSSVIWGEMESSSRSAWCQMLA